MIYPIPVIGTFIAFNRPFSLASNLVSGWIDKRSALEPISHFIELFPVESYHPIIYTMFLAILFLFLAAIGIDDEVLVKVFRRVVQVVKRGHAGNSRIWVQWHAPVRFYQRTILVLA